MTKKFYFLSSLLVVLLFNSISVFSQSLVTVTATPSEGCAPLTTKIVASHPNTNYFEWDINGNAFIGKEITYTFLDNPYGYVTAYDTTGGNKIPIGGEQVQVNLINPIYINVSKDTLCVNGDLRVSTQNFQVSSIDFGDGTISKESHTTHIYSQVGSYTIKVIGKNSCNETFEYLKKVEVRNDVQPKVDFYGPYEVICPGESASFSPGNSSNSSKYTWNFGDGTTATKDYVSHSWANVGKYNVTLTETNACGLTKSHTKEFEVSSNKKITNVGYHVSSKLACPNTKIHYGIYNKSSYKSIVLNYGDNTISSPTDEYLEHAYAAAGKYYPNVILTNFCGHDTTIFLDTITIRSDLKWSNNQEINIDVKDSVCPGEQFHYDVYSNHAVTYAWDLGGGVTNNKSYGLHSYNTLGIHNLKVTLTNGCGSDTTINGSMVVSNNLAATGFDFGTPSDSICPGDSAIIFLDNNHLKDYKWNFGDGTISNTTYEIMMKEEGLDYKLYYQKHVYKTAGEYNVKVEFSNYCGAKGVDSMNVFVKNNLIVDTAAFDIGALDYPVTTCAPVRFFGYGGKSYTWNFGDGTAPINTNNFITPHTYNQAGAYNVSLTITNSCGNSGTITDNITVTQDCITGVEEGALSENFLTIFPNPVSNTATIKLNSSTSAPVNIYVVDGFGIRRTVSNNVANGSEGLVLNVQTLNLQEGIYMLCVEKEGKVISKKISVVK